MALAGGRELPRRRRHQKPRTQGWPAFPGLSYPDRQRPPWGSGKLRLDGGDGRGQNPFGSRIASAISFVKQHGSISPERRHLPGVFVDERFLLQKLFRLPWRLYRFWALLILSSPHSTAAPGATLGPANRAPVSVWRS